METKRIANGVDPLALARDAARQLPNNGIVEVLQHPDAAVGNFIPLLAGEGDQPTPAFICDAVKQSLDAGETFYTHQNGLPELREALSQYHANVYGRPIDPDRFIATGSGMQAIQLALQATVGSGDEVIVPTPTWPNVIGALEVLGAKPISLPLDFDGDQWSLDLDKLAQSVTPHCRALFLNSPSNPTGWAASEDELRSILEFARLHQIWIIADEVYNRIYFEGPRAASFYDLCEANDPIIFVNTFSKNWAMTGWRIGWISAPSELRQIFENLVQYSTSGVPVFLQRGAIAALTQGETFLQSEIARFRVNRDTLTAALADCRYFRSTRPRGGFYYYLEASDQIQDQRSDSISTMLLKRSRIATAPSHAFFDRERHGIRICFARNTQDIEQAATAIREFERIA